MIILLYIYVYPKYLFDNILSLSGIPGDFDDLSSFLSKTQRSTIMTNELKCPFCGGEMLCGIGHPVCYNSPDCPIHDEDVPRELLDLLDRTKKQLDRAKWWLKEIVENHRYTPITTAEMALKELDKEKPCI